MAVRLGHQCGDLTVRTREHICDTHNIVQHELFNPETRMPRAIELDENGKMVITPGIAFGPPPGKLDIVNLEPADVLVWYSSDGSRISSLIREFSGGPYSHVGIYVRDGVSVDAGPAGVGQVSVADLMTSCNYARVMRRVNLTAHDQAAVVEEALGFVGRGYAWFDSITLPARRKAYWKRWSPHRKLDLFALLGRCLTALRRRFPPSPENTFCSRMVVEAYAAIGFFPTDLVEECVFTPNDLAIDHSFMYEGWLCDTDKPIWHPLDPYSPERVRQRRWNFSLARIVRGTSTGGK